MTTLNPKIKIGISPGDPRGIGFEIIQKSLADEQIKQKADFVVYGEEELQAGIKEKCDDVFVGHWVIKHLEQATQDALDHKIDALVTAPITKKSLEAAGYPWPGHTEFLAEKCNIKRAVMMLAAPKLKVSLVTIHCPLKEVSQSITQEKIIETVKITFDSLKKYWRIDQPRVAVCGLNPHAGEKGLLGDEEINIIAPALHRLRQEDYLVEGPSVPDAIFHEALTRSSDLSLDAIVCMYHDQGLIPFKMLYFNEGVNVSLGLPIIRTSPDHGVAFDIAGQNKADASSMKSAIELAIHMAECKKNFQTQNVSNG